MEFLRTLASLRAAATPGPLHLERIHDFGDDSWIIPGALRGKYGNNSLGFEADEATGRFVEATVKEVPRVAEDLRRAEEVLERIEDEVSWLTATHPELYKAVVELRSILTPGA